jgi:lipid-A-disaccharide synthase
MLRVGIVANEMSGDLLGAGLMQALRERAPDVAFEGVGGPRMIEQGCNSLLPMERLSVMGLVEVLRHLPELLAIRRQLTAHFLSNPPDIFIGIDAPDFNLGLETRLRQAGITTVHYVCPSVWAWRAGRVKKIRAAVDLLLSIFPFEEEFLRSHQVPVSFVGHPLADEIPLQTDQAVARQTLGLPVQGEVIALLPGSRMSEINALGETFIQTAAWCLERRPGLRFIVPLVSANARRLFEQRLQAVASELPVILLDGRAQEAIAAADVVLSKSGTATLEALLLGRPMVVGYRLHPLTYYILKWLNLVKIPYVAMANLLSGEPLAPEFIQHECRPELLGGALLGFLDDPERMAAVKSRYHQIHQEMQRDSSRRAAEAVVSLIQAKVS